MAFNLGVACAAASPSDRHRIHRDREHDARGCRGTTLAPGDVSPASCRRHVAHPPLDRLRIDTLVIGFLTTAPGSFTTRLTLFDPLANLSITRGGRVYYTYESRPGTGSGGQAIAKEWDIPADEAGRLLDAVVADGLLDQPDVTPGGTCGFIVTSGRWQMRGSLASMPPAILARL